MEPRACTCQPTTGTDYEPHDPDCPMSNHPQPAATKVRRVPAWTVAVSEHSHYDYVYICRHPWTGKVIEGYDETVRQFPDVPPPVFLVHRLAAVEISR